MLVILTISDCQEPTGVLFTIVLTGSQRASRYSASPLPSSVWQGKKKKKMAACLAQDARNEEKGREISHISIHCTALFEAALKTHGLPEKCSAHGQVPHRGSKNSL